MSAESASPVIPPVEVRTPLTEWSDSVLASASSSSSSKFIPGTFPETPQSAENVGAPKDKSPEESKQPETQSPSDSVDKPSVGTSVVQAAREYVIDPVGRTVGGATQNIKSSMSSYWSPEEPEENPHKVSLPSSELKGAHPSEHTGGVGALPGNASESGVALLPDERQEINKERLSTSSRQRRDTVKPSLLSGNDEPREPEEVEAQIAPVVPEPSNGMEGKSQQEGKIESQEAIDDRGKVGGIARSGMPGEVIGTEEPDKQRVETGSEESEKASGKLGLDKSTSQDDHDGRKEGQTTPAKKSAGGYGGDYHPAQLHPPPPGASVADYKYTISSDQQATHDTQAATGAKRDSTGSEKKPGFITMVKGEMKILAGKVSRDEQKVQEGKKLVHGDA